MSNLQRQVELIHHSSERLMKLMPMLRRDKAWWTAMDQEVKLHIARTDELKKMVRKREE